MEKVLCCLNIEPMSKVKITKNTQLVTELFLKAAVGKENIHQDKINSESDQMNNRPFATVGHVTNNF